MCACVCVVQIGALSKDLPAKYGVPGVEVIGGQQGSECTWGAACHDGTPQPVTKLAGTCLLLHAHV